MKKKYYLVKKRSRFNILIFFVFPIHTITGCSKTPHTTPSPSPIPSTSSLPAPGVLTSTHSNLYRNLTHLLAEGLREDSSSQPRTAPGSENFDLSPDVTTSDSESGLSYENLPAALPPYVPTAVAPRRIEEAPPEDTPIIRPGPPIREMSIFPRSLRTIDLHAFLYGAQTLQAYFIPVAHQMIEPQDFKLVVRKNAGRFDDSVTAPTVGQLKHIMRTQPQLIFNLFQQIGINNLQELREIFWTLPNSDTPFMRHDIGNYHAIIRVRKMYSIRTPLAEPTQGVLIRTLSRAESDLENILLDHFIAYVTEGMLAQNLRLSENSKDWLRYDFRRFNRMDGSFEQNIIRLLDYIELSYFDRAIHPTDRTSPIPDEYFAVKNAIYAIALEESFSRHLNLSLTGSPSRDMLDPNDQRDVTQYFYSTLRDSFIRNPIDFGNQISRILREARHRMSSAVYMADQIEIERGGRGRVQFHTSNAMNRILFEREFLNHLNHLDPHLFHVGNFEYTYLKSLIEFSIEKPGSFEQRVRDLELKVTQQRNVTYADGARQERVFSQNFIEGVIRGIRTWLTNEARTFSGDATGGAGNVAIAQELIDEQRFNEHSNQTHLNPMTNRAGMFFYHQTMQIPSISAETGTAGNHFSYTPGAQLRSINITCLQQHELTYLFQKIVQRDDIIFSYPADGCYARAHIMTDFLASFGVESAKIYSYAEGTNLSVHSNNNPTGDVTWGYHVAPLVAVQDRSGHCTLKVIDPSLDLFLPLDVDGPHGWYSRQITHMMGDNPQPRQSSRINPAIHNYGLNQTIRRNHQDAHGYRARFFYQYTDRHAYTPSYFNAISPWAYSGDTRSYAQTMENARQVQREKGHYLLIAKSVKAYMQKKGLWAR